jgi:hypothetical protein
VTNGLSQEQVALVLRRAAELDRDLGMSAPPGLDEAAVEQAALEAGLSRVAVRRALAELRAGMLDVPPAHRDRSRGILGPAVITLTRTVPGPAGAVERELHRFLEAQLFEIRRDMGSRTIWVRRRGIEATARRAVDRAVTRKLILKDVHNVDASVVEHDEEWVLVRLDVDVLAVRHTQGTITGSAAVAGGGLAAVTAAAAGLHPAFLLVAAAGAGIAGGGHRLGSKLYRRRVGEVESGVAGFLDRLERGQRARVR